MTRFIFPVLFTLTVILFSFTYRDQTPGKGNAGRQIQYVYRSESLVYSELAQLYTTDSSKNKLSFFNKPGLLSIQGTLTCTVTKTFLMPGTAFQLIVFQVTGPQLHILQTGFHLDTSLIKKEICKPVFIAENRQGNIETVFTHSSLSPASVSIVKDIISRFQFVKAPGKEEQWETKEVNPAGSYTAAYHMAKRGGFTYIKENKGYDKGAAGQSHHPIAVESYAVISMDSLQGIENEDLSESFVTLAGKDTLSLSGNKTVIRKRSAIYADRSALFNYYRMLSGPAYRKSSTLSVQLSEEEIIESAYTNTLGSDTWNTLENQLSGLANPSDKQAEQLVMKLRALATLRPEACDKMIHRLTKENFGSLSYNLLSQAVGRTATPAASEGLAKMMVERQHEKEVVMDLLPLLAVNPAPTANAIRTVRRLGFENKSDPDIVSTAQLALGSMVFHLRKNQPLQAAELCVFILKNTEWETDTLQKLLVLGNTGDPAICAWVLPVINTAGLSSVTRCRAIKALRLLPGEKVDPLLSSLNHSKDSLIREAVREVIAFRKQFFSH